VHARAAITRNAREVYSFFPLVGSESVCLLRDLSVGSRGEKEGERKLLCSDPYSLFFNISDNKKKDLGLLPSHQYSLNFISPFVEKRYGRVIWSLIFVPTTEKERSHVGVFSLDLGGIFLLTPYLVFLL